MNMIETGKFALGVAALAALGGCTTMSHLEGKVPGTTVSLAGMARTELPRDEDVGSKSTGQYEFVATGPDGKKFYGLLPLKVNGKTMAASILLFAPALAIGGFRDAYPFYQFDVDNGILRYKSEEKGEWRQYVPVAVEVERAKQRFNAAPDSARQAGPVAPAGSIDGAK